jgi:hypothetical protein
MVGNLEKFVAIVGAPVAVLYSLGLIAFVNDLWRVEFEHGFRYLAAWHAAGFIDREVILGTGVWFLFWSLVVSFVVLQVLSFFVESLRKYTILPPNISKAQAGSTPQPIPQEPVAVKWLSLVMLSLPIGIGVVLLWSFSNPDGLLNNMPCVEMVKAIGAEDAEQDSPAGTATEEPVNGVLLSSDSAYWYVLDNSKGRVLAIPLAEASEIQVLPRRPADIICP